MVTAAPARLTGATTAADEHPALALSGVTKRFGDSVLALDEVSLEIPVGQRAVLLGRSGSGKSTLLRHVNRLHTPTNGRVQVHGTTLEDLSGRGIRAVRREVGFIFQDFHLVGSMTALENVCTGLLGTLRGPRLGLWSYPKSGRRRALELLDRVELADRAFQRADTLSGGQQQRVAIARALIQEPSILLADEPVASLDPESSAGVLEVLTRISTEDRITMLCSLHQVDFALSFAERIIGIRSGQVVLDDLAARVSRERAMTIYRPAPARAA